MVFRYFVFWYNISNFEIAQNKVSKYEKMYQTQSTKFQERGTAGLTWQISDTRVDHAHPTHQHGQHREQSNTGTALWMHSF